MDRSSLTQLYDQIKSEANKPVPIAPAIGMGTDDTAWRNKAVRESDKLKDHAAKMILLDIYCKVLPLDTSFILGNRGRMRQDIDDFLSSKDMTASQYLTSAYERTKAPLLAFLLRACDNIGKEFMKESREIHDDAIKHGINVPPPTADPECDEIAKVIVDIETDMEYSGFVDRLRDKTIKQIVDNVSDLIADEKKNEKMIPRLSKADVVEESTIAIVYDYVNEKLAKECFEMTPETNEEIIGIAIRESVLFQFDRVFRQPYSDFTNFRSRIRFGMGYIINESVARSFIEEPGE